MTDWQIKNKSGTTPPLVVLPGWGFGGELVADHPAFAGETVIFSPEFASPAYLGGLVDFLVGQGFNTVRMLGWSMGGNLALDFAESHPDYISSLVLVSVRHHWRSAEIATTRAELFDPHRMGMAKFYRKCFLGDKKEFKRNASRLQSYADQYDAGLLDSGLSYLESYIMPNTLSCPVRLFQGEKDVICPASETVMFANTPPPTILAGAAHFLFSHPGFTL